jgi:4-hydroxybenzoate polyprenyltransferase
MQERFPLRNAVFFAVFQATALLVARAAGADGPVTVEWRDLAAFPAVWCFFLMLRVFDEHKDFDADSVAHPNRVLQRGLVTLRDLRVVGAVAITVQVGTSWWFDGGIGPVTAWWSGAFLWSILMAREFFVRAWLRRHLIVYALTHIVVMVFLAMWIGTMGSPRAASTVAPWVFAGVSVLAGLAFEVARKIRAPEQEHPLADSYTQALGVPVASRLLAALTVATAISALWLTVLLTGRLGTVALVALASVVVLAGAALARFGTQPTPRGAKRSEAAVGIAALVTHVVIIGALLTEHGVRLP